MIRKVAMRPGSSNPSLCNTLKMTPQRCLAHTKTTCICKTDSNSTCSKILKMFHKVQANAQACIANKICLDLVHNKHGSCFQHCCYLLVSTLARFCKEQVWGESICTKYFEREIIKYFYSESLPQEPWKKSATWNRCSWWSCYRMEKPHYR